ncbi:sugar phosphate isomerase/epimerase [Candidatus Poribacteria bacterium]|nr:sugar phosphate isomerase/epimerase [Candidatus Poribacteria bacterium]
MIKVGCMSLSYKDVFPSGDMTLEGLLETAYDMRLDGVDLHTSAFSSTDDGALRDIRRACHRRGLAISYLAVSNNFGKTGDALRSDIDLTKKWTDVAQRMGVPLVRIFAAWLPKDEPEDAVWARMFGAIREVVDYAAERDVVIGLHNHNHGCVTRTGDDVLRILDTIDSPYFSHILDTGQYVGSPGASGADRSADAAEQLYNSISTSAHRAVHVRAKFYRVASGVEEWLDYPRILEILKGVDYNGWMSVVYEGWEAEPSGTAVPKAVAHLRALLADADM